MIMSEISCSLSLIQFQEKRKYHRSYIRHTRLSIGDWLGLSDFLPQGLVNLLTFALVPCAYAGNVSMFTLYALHCLPRYLLSIPNFRFQQSRRYFIVTL